MTPLDNSQNDSAQAVARLIAAELGATCRMGEDIVSPDDLRRAEIDIGTVDLICIAEKIICWGAS